MYALLTVPYDSRPQAIDVANVNIKYSTPEVAEMEQNEAAVDRAIIERSVCDVT